MSGRTTHVADRTTGRPVLKFVVAGLLVLLLAIAVGHLYAFRGLTELYLGLPLWIWLQILVVVVLLGVAWITIRLIGAAADGGG